MEGEGREGVEMRGGREAGRDKGEERQAEQASAPEALC